VETAGELLLQPSAGGEPLVYSLTPGSLLWVAEGETVAAGQLLAEVALAKVQRSTERATKDVAANLAGEVLFADLVPEEKTDRQGNTTRIAQRGGLLWVLSGDVYNLLPGAEPMVSNGDQVAVGDVLAETRLVTVSGGVVRAQPGSREIEIVTASVLLEQARVAMESTGGREQYAVTNAEGQRFLLRAAPGTKVQNHAIVAELMDERYRVLTGGILRYAGVEVAKGGRKQGYEVVKGGSLLWIPEETHEVNKDISLLLVEDGQYVEAGTEVVKDIFCRCSGVVEVIQRNDILREIGIKPGELLWDVEPELAICEDGQLIPPGTELLPGVVTAGLRQAEWIEGAEGMGLLLRPVEEFVVGDQPANLSQGSISQEGGRHIELRSVQRLFFKDGERVKSVEPVQLLSTQLVLEISGAEAVENLAADIELLPDEAAGCLRLQLVILESLVLRRDLDADPLGGKVQTKVLVRDGETIPPRAVVARTEIQCQEAGVVQGIRRGFEAVRRILILRDADLVTRSVPGQALVGAGDLLVAGSELAPGVPALESGLVVSVENLQSESQNPKSKIQNPTSK
jgi:DNA-directed RNA polymerase subunit beta'